LFKIKKNRERRIQLQVFLTAVMLGSTRRTARSRLNAAVTNFEARWADGGATALKSSGGEAGGLCGGSATKPLDRPTERPLSSPPSSWSGLDVGILTTSYPPAVDRQGDG
jgi:hypothetical protein